MTSRHTHHLTQSHYYADNVSGLDVRRVDSLLCRYESDTYQLSELIIVF